MANYAMTCSCGHTMSIEAQSRDEAVAKFTAFMTQEALDQHMAQLHPPAEPKPTLTQAHAMISQMVATA